MVSKDNPKVSTRILGRPLLYRGVYTRVARKVGVSRQFVAMVGRGMKRSKKVEAALLSEISRIEKKIAA